MSEDDEDQGAKVIVIRHSDGTPVVVPTEVAMVADLPYRCYLHHRSGMSWANIAEIEDQPSGRAVQAMVQRYLDDAHALVQDFSRNQLVSLELERLNTVMAVHWPKMLEGNIASANLVLVCIRDRSKLLRLDQPVLDGQDAATHGGTVVVPDDEEGYSRALEKAAR